MPGFDPAGAGRRTDGADVAATVLHMFEFSITYFGRCSGALPSLRSLSQLELLLPVFDFTKSGSMLPLRSHTRLEPVVLTMGVACSGPTISPSDTTCPGMSLPSRQLGQLGSSSVPAGLVRLNPAASTLDFVTLDVSLSLHSCARLGHGEMPGDWTGVVHLGSPFSSRHFVRCGSASSALGAAVVGFTTPVLDAVQLETLSLLRSLSRLGSSTSASDFSQMATWRLIGAEFLKPFHVCKTHLGTRNVDYRMKRYIFRRTVEGIHIIHLGKTWEKLMVAARMIVAIENPADIIVASQRPYGSRAVLKFSQYTGANPLAGRWTPGTLTNQITQKYLEPRLLIVTDPRTDSQAIKEASYASIPVIALCDTDSPLENVDVTSIDAAKLDDPVTVLGIKREVAKQLKAQASNTSAMSKSGLSYLLLLSVAFATGHEVKRHSVIMADGRTVMRKVADAAGRWQPTSQTDSIPSSSGLPWPSPVAVHAARKDGPKEPKGKGEAVGPNNLKEAEAEVAKFFKIEEMVAKETGLPLNSSSAAEKEMEDEARKAEEEEEEEEGRVDLLYASMVVCLILVAGLAYYRWRQGREQKPPAEAATGVSK
eukprot:s1323_g3.t1